MSDLDALKRDLDDAGNVGLDLSPGDPLVAKAVAAICELEAEAERLRGENDTLKASVVALRDELEVMVTIYDMAKDLIDRGDNPMRVPFTAVHGGAVERARTRFAETEPKEGPQ